MKRLDKHFHAFLPLTYDELPPGAELIDMKWVLKTKLHRLKARLVACQMLSKHWESDKFSPTLSISTLRLMLAFAAVYDCKISTVDIAGAYLYAELAPEDRVYLRVPPGLRDAGYTDFLDSNGRPARYAKCTRAIYGLQKSGK